MQKYKTKNINGHVLGLDMNRHTYYYYYYYYNCYSNYHHRVPVDKASERNRK